MVLVAFGSLSKSSILVCSLIDPFRCLLYFGILLTERAATSERTSQRFVQRRMRGIFHQLARCCHFAGHCLKENQPPPFVGRSLFSYACVIPFSCQKPLGVSAYFNNFSFLIQFNCFFIFIYSFPTFCFYSSSISFLDSITFTLSLNLFFLFSTRH